MVSCCPCVDDIKYIKIMLKVNELKRSRLNHRSSWINKSRLLSFLFLCAGHSMQTSVVRDEPSVCSWTIIPTRENGSCGLNMQLMAHLITKPLSTSVLLFSTPLLFVSVLVWPYRFVPTPGSPPLARLFSFISTVNLQHGFDPSSWQWSGNKLQWAERKAWQLCSSISAVWGGKQPCHEVSWAKYIWAPRPTPARTR